MDFYLVESGHRQVQLEPGLYHYTPIRHAWEKLSSGDKTHRVAQAQGYADCSDRYLIMTINYWRSGFKYNDFAYQATAMDVGTTMASMAEAVGDGIEASWDMWTNEDELAPLLGLDPMKDGVYAVQAWGQTHRMTEQPDGLDTPISRRVLSKHRETRDFETTLALQRDMRGFPLRPKQIRPKAVTAGTSINRHAHWLDNMLRRRTSFGRFTGQGYPVDDLLGLLQRADQVSNLVAPNSFVEWQYLVYAAKIEGLKPGLYRYRSFSNYFEPLSFDTQQEFLASTYFLKNYDGRKAAATVIPCANVYRCAHEWGVRGYRLINAVIGAGCQALSVEAARRGLGSGTALGFDAEAHAQHSDMDKEVMTPMLMIMTGVDDARSGQFHSNTTVRRV
ncbi:nitroreductase family protein [Devriesea agamarum]|uniref:nitroreductase family protein n=1 Tax=Devriesea agamarum TaxID=472569 RepID=UPI00071D1675|nr:hypothetical protein [Devriesea agamarum]